MFVFIYLLIFAGFPPVFFEQLLWFNTPFSPGVSPFFCFPARFDQERRISFVLSLFVLFRYFPLSSRIYAARKFIWNKDCGKMGPFWIPFMPLVSNPLVVCAQHLTTNINQYYCISPGCQSGFKEADVLVLAKAVTLTSTAAVLMLGKGSCRMLFKSIHLPMWRVRIRMFLVPMNLWHQWVQQDSFVGQVLYQQFLLVMSGSSLESSVCCLNTIFCSKDKNIILNRNCAHFLEEKAFLCLFSRGLRSKHRNKSELEILSMLSSKSSVNYSP